MKKTFLLFSCIFLLAAYCSAQNNVVGTPYSFTHSNISNAIDRVDLPALDKAALLEEDAQMSKEGAPLRFGAVHHVSYNFSNSGRMDILPDGSRLWRLSLHSPEALSMAVFFSSFNIPEGATMHIYNADRTILTGSYTAADIQPNGVLASEFIEGDEVVIEYFEPADALFHGTIEIDRVSHVYRNMWDSEDPKGSVDDAGDCHYHAVCPEGANWRNQIRSVVRISITGSTGSYYCSGALVNNVRMDKTPYVLTANHCMDGLNSAFSFYFFYQFRNCNGTGKDQSKYVNGGEIKAYVSTNSNTGIYNSSDFMLLKITGNLFGQSWVDSIYYAGWDATGAASVGLAIHHPAGERKRISFPRTVSSTYYDPNYWLVYWHTNPNKGCTEEGSSGSPLFNASKLIIGDLSTGTSSCEQPDGYDNYGKLSYSWTNGNNTSDNKKLKPWLDPDGTGTLVLPGMDYHGVVDNINDYTSTYRAFEIIPTPSTGSVSIKGAFEEGAGICNVYNTLGALVSSSDITLSPSFNMNFNHLENGIYFVEILGGGQTYHSKMVIAR